jgi:hypothetical protein
LFALVRNIAFQAAGQHRPYRTRHLEIEIEIRRHRLLQLRRQRHLILGREFAQAIDSQCQGNLRFAAIRGLIIIAVSAPTALAVRMADAAGMTLVAIARKDGFEVFTHPHRVKGTLSSHVA